jgi:hypothetical protein
MTVEITKLEMPENKFDWGILQINNFSNTYYRFSMIDGKPKLDTTYFADQIQDRNEKHRNFPEDSKMYKDIQQALDVYIKENENHARR